MYTCLRYVPAGVSRNKFKHLIKGTLLWRYILLSFYDTLYLFQFCTVYYLRGYVMPGVCLSVCVSVCLYGCWQLYVKTTERIFMKISPQMYNMHKTKLIKFWKSNASGSGCTNCLKDSSTLRDGIFFHNLAYISPKRVVLTSGRIVLMDMSGPNVRWGIFVGGNPYKMTYLDPVVNSGKPQETVRSYGFYCILITLPWDLMGHR